MDFYQELIESPVTCEGCGLAKCQCHRIKSVSRDAENRPAVVVFFADDGQSETPAPKGKRAPVQPPSTWVGVVLIVGAWSCGVVCGLLLARAAGWL